MVSLYKILNTVNGKLYFGKTHLPLAARWLKHLKDARAGASWSLSRAIRKYGPASFEHIFLFSVDSEAEANAAEKDLIRTNQTFLPEKGYNLTMGGDGISDPPKQLLVRRRAAQIAAMRQPGCKKSTGRFGFGRTAPQFRGDVETSRVVSLYASGESLRSVANIVGFNTVSGVLSRLRKAGCIARPVGRPRSAA